MSSDKPWKDRCSFLTPEAVEHEVNGTVLRFRAVSLKSAFGLKDVAGPIASALSTLFANQDSDFGSSNKSVPDGEGGMARETTIQAITPEMARTRNEINSKAVQTVVDSLMSEGTQKAFAVLILDSLREEPTMQPPPPVSEFLSQCPLPSLAPLLIGVAKANKGIFGPLSGPLGNAAREATLKIVSRVAQDSGESNASQNPPPQS